MIPSRITYLRGEMRRRGVSRAYLTPGANLFYLTGMRGGMMERLTCCVIGERTIDLIAPGFELAGLGEPMRSLFACHGWSDGEDPFQILRELHPPEPHTFAVSGQTPSWVLLRLEALYPESAWVNLDEIVGVMRLCKDESEYESLREVHRRTAAALTRLIEHGVRGMTEREVARLYQDCCAAVGVEAGPPSVASGPNSALPHHHNGDRVIVDGDVVVIDFGGQIPGEGYHADATRTFAVGRIPEGFSEIYDIVLRANRAAFEAAKPGAACEGVDAAAREVIEAAGYGEYFTHRLGHGLGLEVHEEPYLARGSKSAVAARNCFSDEPGIYLPGRYGVRIEDTLFIHADGAECLTPYPRELEIIG